MIVGVVCMLFFSLRGKGLVSYFVFIYIWGISGIFFLVIFGLGIILLVSVGVIVLWGLGEKWVGSTV